MKSFVSKLAALAVAGALTSSAAAQQYPPGYPIQPGVAPGYGGPVPVMHQAVAPHHSEPCTECAGDRYGFHPTIKKIFGIKRSVATCEHGPVLKKAKGGLGLGLGDWFHSLKAKYGPPSDPAEQEMPRANGGTLAFPHHPYVRSPRDFFMVDR